MKHVHGWGIALVCTLGLLGCTAENGADGDMAGDTTAVMDGMTADGMNGDGMQTDPGQVRSQIEAANTQFEQYIENEQYDSLETLYTSDAQVMAPNAPTASGADLTTVFEQMGGMGVASIDLRTSEVEVFDEFAYEVGTYSAEGADGSQVDTGKYVVIWRMEDGEWRIHRDIFNSDMPPMNGSASDMPSDTTQM